mgnify:CR=1 FL=1
MKNNNLIQEEINRAKHLWSYDTNKTMSEQVTGTSNTCYAITQLAPCSGGTLYVGYANWCFSVNGAAGTQGDNGTVVTTNDGMTGTIQSTAPISNPPTNYIIPFTQTTCPNTNTGTTNSGTTNSGTTNSGTTGGPMKPTISFCSGGTFTPHYAITLNGSDLTQADVNKTIMGNYSTPNGNPNSGQFGQFDSFHGTITSIIPSTVGVLVDTSEVPCGLPPGTGTGTTTSTCNKSCQQMAPNFKSKVKNKPCKWLKIKLTVLTTKLTTKTPGTCAHKRIMCKISVIKANLLQQGC